MQNLIPLKYRIRRYATAFSALLDQDCAVDADLLVVVGDKPVPVLRCGSTPLNLNFAVPDEFTEQTGVTATIFVRSNNDFIRITTSIKKQDGERAIGTLLDRSHPAYKPLLSGESYVGFASIFGVQYMTQYDPIHDRAGSIVGVRYVGLNVSTVRGIGLPARIAFAAVGSNLAVFALFQLIAGTMLAGSGTLAAWAPVAIATAFVFVTVYAMIHRNISRTLAAGKIAAQTIAGGDLSAQIHVDRHDDMGQMLQGINGISVGLATVVGNVRNATENIGTAAEQIAAGNTDLSSRTESQAASLEETASAMEQLTSTVHTNAESAKEADALVKSISGMAAEGGAIVSRVVDTMGRIKTDAHRIEDIIGLIDGIAFQTNILALNAAVEAARAGEQGRGFAVVASEVRNLAQRSASAAKEIKTLVSASVASVDQGNQLAGNAGKTMAGIVESVEQAAILVAGIATSSDEQSRGIDEINRAIGQMDEMTQQNAALVEEAAAASLSLRDQATLLTTAVSVFKTAA